MGLAVRSQKGGFQGESGFLVWPSEERIEEDW